MDDTGESRVSLFLKPAQKTEEEQMLTSMRLLAHVQGTSNYFKEQLKRNNKTLSSIFI